MSAFNDIKIRVEKTIDRLMDKGQDGHISLEKMHWVLGQMGVILSEIQFYKLVKASSACSVKYSALVDEIFSGGENDKNEVKDKDKDKAVNGKKTTQVQGTVGEYTKPETELGSREGSRSCSVEAPAVDALPPKPKAATEINSSMPDEVGPKSMRVNSAPVTQAEAETAPGLTQRCITWPLAAASEEMPVGPEVPGLDKYSTTLQPLEDEFHEFGHLGSLRVSCWNVKSPELQGNILEMYPGWSMLTNPEQCELLDDLMDISSRKLLGEDCLTLGEILGDKPDKELRECMAMGSPEMLPLNAEKYTDPQSKQSLKKFFEVRLDPTQPLDEFMQEWLEKPAVRWQYWKKQSVREFIAEDGSGGKSEENELLVTVKKPILDAVAWDATLGVADLKYGWHGRRVSRCSWLLLTSESAAAGGPKVPESGVVDYDFFKLAVWDLLLGAVKDEARQNWRNGPDAWDEVFGKAKHSLAEINNPQKNLENIVGTIASFHSDIVVLSELSKAMIGTVPPQDSDTQLAEFCQSLQEAGGQQYTLFKSGITDDVSNTVILARRDRFTSGVLMPFVSGKDGKVDNKNFGVKLKSIDGTELQVIGVHLSGGGHNVKTFFDELERRLERYPSKTIVAGDFNFDFRQKKKRASAIEGRPLCEKLLEQSKKLWDLGLEWGTVSKKRTPFQAQVSKINLTDFVMKDFILISEDLSPDKGCLSGYIARAQILPDASCPSDHHPLTWQAPDVPRDESELDAQMRQGLQACNIPQALRKPQEIEEHPERHELGNVLENLKRRAEEDDRFKTTLCGIMELHSSEAPAKINRHITSVRNGFLCEYAFKKSSTIHRNLVTEIVEVSSHTNQKDTLTRKDFNLLHEAVANIVGPCGQASFARTAEILSYKPDEDFAKVDYNYNGELDATEVLVWLKQIAHVHRPWKESVTKCLEEVLLRCRAKKEVQKYELARELMNTMELYDEAYQEFLEMIQNKKEFRDLRKEFSTRHFTKSHSIDMGCLSNAGDETPKTWDRATVFEVKSEGETDPQQPQHLKTYEELFHHGQEIVEQVADFGEELRHAVRAPFWSMGQMKGSVRALEKSEADYGGDISRLLDVVRFSLLCKDLAMVKNVIDYVKRHDKWEVVRIKSGFDPDHRCAVTGGYRDVKINARNKDNGHVIEIQLHILMFYVIKQEMGHKLYEDARVFDVQGITCADDILAELSPALLKEMASVAKEDLEKTIRESGESSKKSLEKRMTLFDCLRLARSSKADLAEHGKILLNAVGEGDDNTNSTHSNDKHFHRSVMLLIGRAHYCELPAGVTHHSLLEKVAAMIGLQSGTSPGNIKSTSCGIVLAQCKSSTANIIWGATGCDNSVIENTQQAVEIYIDCGLPKDHPVVLKSMKNLGSAWVHMGDLKTGIQVLLETQAGLTRHFGFRDHRTAQVLLELGIAFRKESMEKGGVNELRLKALWYLSHGLSGRRAAFGEEDERVGNVFFEIALAKAEHQDYKGALQDFKTCVSIWDKADVWEMKKTREKESLDMLQQAFQSANHRSSISNETFHDEFQSALAS